MAGTACTGTAPEKYFLSALQSLSVQYIHVTLVRKPESRKKGALEEKISLRLFKLTIPSIQITDTFTSPMLA